MFFSVKSTVKIAGNVYTPCVCYALPETLKLTIEKMVREDKAYIYDHKVAFQNGKVIAKKAEVEQPKTKKAKKEKVIEDEDVPSPEEIAEGF